MTADLSNAGGTPFSVRIDNRPKPVYDAGEGHHYDKSVAEWLVEDGNIIVYIYPTASGDGDIRSGHAYQKGYRKKIKDSVLEQVKAALPGFVVEYEEFIPALILTHPDSLMINAEPLVTRAVRAALVALGIRGA